MNVDPLADKYYNLSPYNYVANNPIMFIDPDGRSITLPPGVLPLELFLRTSWGKSLTLPPPPAISPFIPLYPDISIPIDLDISELPSLPYALENAGEIDWENNPPATPEDLGKEWEETTDARNKSGGRDFKNKDTGEKIRYDHGREGKLGYEGENHWHRHNPNYDQKTMGKKINYYLDAKGQPVNKGSGPSHIVPSIGPSLPTFSELPEETQRKILQNKQHQEQQQQERREQYGIDNIIM